MIGSWLTFRIKDLPAALCLMLIGIGANGQVDSLKNLDPIQVIARPSLDSIALRWAPIDAAYWLAGNRYGYTIERYTLARNGKALTQPEKKVLTTTAITPYPEPQWEKVVKNNKYATIAAQALLGESFEIEMEHNKSSSTAIVNKVQENEQRFSIALFCADLSVSTAKALGLYFVDREVKKGEKYLYRISTRNSKTESIRGSVFVAADDPYQLTAPTKFSSEIQNNVVMLRWNQSYHKRTYTTYSVERSEDGKNFRPISEDPVTTLSPSGGDETEFQYTYDSLQDSSKEYYYRVKGVTPFGEQSPPSEVKKVKVEKVITELPYITSAISTDNKSMTVAWDFPAQHNNNIEGFYLERAVSPSGTYDKAHADLISKEARTFRDLSPKQTNYYRVSALTMDKKIIRSMTYYAQLVDSIPPATPSGVEGKIDEYGNVAISWRPNTEDDIYGYRVYRTYYTTDEFAQLTSGPVKESQFRDKVELQSLNEKIHYRIMAVDNNQNQSILSDILTLSLPDKVPPVAPVFLPVKSDEKGVTLKWMPSGSTDVIHYDLYRKGEQGQWIRLTTTKASTDSVYTYVDNSLKNGEERHYTVIAVDDGNLESPPASVVTGRRIKRSVWPAVSLQTPELDRTSNQATLRWKYDESDVKQFHVYRAVNDEPLMLYRSVAGKEFTDRMTPQNKYQFKIVAVFKDGSKSEMGQGVSFTF